MINIFENQIGDVSYQTKAKFATQRRNFSGKWSLDYFIWLLWNLSSGSLSEPDF